MEKDLSNLEIIELFKRLRVTDVRDGMDWMGYHHYGSLHHSFRPLYRPESSVIGIARTARYVPFEGPVPFLSPEEYTKWVSWYYTTVLGEPWVNKITPGDFLCMDVAGLDVGFFGSNNTLDCIRKGAVGFLTNGGGVRDSDECVIEKVNIWSRFISQPMNVARIRYVDEDTPIAMGGVAIYPGDVIVADGDGVISVPRKIAQDVAKYAWQEASADKASRKKLYIDLGMSLDNTVI